MTSRVKLHLLGPFRAERSGEPVTAFKSNKVRALLSYLALERNAAHHRDVLAGLLWPNSSNTSALALLRDVLSNLRLVLGDREAATPLILVRGDTLQLNPSALTEAVLWMDIVAFSDLTTDSPSEEDLVRAVTLYRGDFLEGFTLASNPDFESWLLLRRESFGRTMLDALYRLTTLRLQRGDFEGALASARRQVAIDHHSEEAHRQMLRALAYDGRRNQALAHYDDYREFLNDELGVAPDIRTTALYQRIRDGRIQHTTTAASATAEASPAPAPSRTPLSPFAGRRSELGWLEARLQETQGGRGQVVFISGEPGSGKTMLAHAFTSRLLARADDAVVACGLCNAQVGAGDPYSPFREILRLLTGDLDVSALGWALAPAYAQRLETFAPAVLRAVRDEGADLIGRFIPAPVESEHLSRVGWCGDSVKPADRLPQSPVALCQAVTRVLRAVAHQSTLVLVVDDLQWGDAGTLNLLAHLGRRLMGSRILLIGIYRSTELDGALLSVVRELQRVHGDITLDLDRAGGRAFVDAFLDSTPNQLAETFRAQLTRQTAGQALFTVALVEQMRHDGTLIQDSEGRWILTRDLDWSRLPPRVEAVIAERLARLSDSRQELLAAASVEGEVFTAEVVAEAMGQDPAAVREELAQLGEDQLSNPQQNLLKAVGIDYVEGHPMARYRFRHALFQRYLYTSLDPIRRAKRHRDIAHALETRYSARRDDIAARLAYHFERAGLLEAAVRYCIRAGRRTYRLSAPSESAALYRRGLGLLEQLPPSADRDSLELELLVNLEAALMTTRGWGASERIKTLQRAYGVAQRFGETSRLLPVLQALSSVHIARGDYRAGLEEARQLLTLGKEVSHELYEVMGLRLVGTAYFFLGHCEQARQSLEAGLRGYAALPAQARRSFHVSAAEENVRLRVWLAHALLLTGDVARARTIGKEALASAEALDYVGVKGLALSSAGVSLHATARRPRATLRYAKQLLAMGEEHDFPSYRGWGAFYRGWALAFQDQPETGIPGMEAGVEKLRGTGTEASLVSLLTLLAEIYTAEGQCEAGEDALHEALALSDETGARSHRPEIHRVQALVHLKDQDIEAAEASLLHAIDVAREQSAKFFELRASVALARLWEDQGRAPEAHARLLRIYDTFTECDDMPDLVAAHALLERLATALS